MTLVLFCSCHILETIYTVEKRAFFGGGDFSHIKIYFPFFVVCNQDVEDSQRMKNHMTAMEAPLYQSYHVYIIHKVRTKTEIHLGMKKNYHYHTSQSLT